MNWNSVYTERYLVIEQVGSEINWYELLQRVFNLNLHGNTGKSETDIISEKAARLKLPTLAWKDALKKHLSGILTAVFRTCVSLSIVETGQIEEEERNHLIEEYMSFSVSSLAVFLFPNLDGVREH